VKELEAEYEETFKDPAKLKEFMNTPPPSEFMISAGQWWLFQRDIVRNSVAQIYNYTIGLGGILGAPIDIVWTAMPVNGPSVTKLLFEVHGH
jgi:hypothetical protein